MVPTTATYLRMINAMAEDTGWLADSEEMKVHLVIDSFSPALDLTLDNLTLATFTGSAALLAGPDEQQVLYDPLTGKWVIQILEPAGGWTWIATAVTDPVQTVYGYALTDNAGTVLIGTGLLQTPVPIANIGDSVSIPQIRFSFSETSPN